MLSFTKKLSILILGLTLLAFGGNAMAQTQKPKVPVEITSDKLTSNPDEKYVEFSGNVKVLYDTYRINSVKLRIYYEQKKDADDDNPLAVEGIKSISAIGNVVITSPEYDINAERADYDLKTEIAVLTGKEVRVMQDKNLITGTKISIDRAKGHINVEGDSDKRVKAVFYTDGEADSILKP